jgi:phosphoglycolate phosphatase-like HAD superfamily hydrolase
MISTVVFDFDGTLVDSNAIKRQGYFAVVAGHPGGAECMQAVLGRVTGDRRAVLTAYREAALKREAGPLPSVDELVQNYGDHVDGQVSAAREVEGAAALLRELKRAGRRIYLSSATPLTSLRRILEQRQWLQYFDDVFGHPASKPETLRVILEVAGVKPRAVAVVGDGVDDRDSAASIGCAFFPVGEARGAERTERVYTLPELLDVLTSQLHSPG